MDNFNPGSFFVEKHTIILIAKHQYINALILEILQIVKLERLPKYRILEETNTGEYNKSGEQTFYFFSFKQVKLHWFIFSWFFM